MPRLFTIILCSFLLVGCESISNQKTTKVNIDIDRTPIALEHVTWKIISQENTKYFALNSDDFEKLQYNIEVVQGELYLYGQTIDELQKYYKNKESQSSKK